MDVDVRVYQLCQAWSDASQQLTRLTQRGGTLRHRDRRTLRAASDACAQLVRTLTGPSDQLADVEVAALLLDVVQPLYSRPLLVEHLARAQSYLSFLAQGEPGLESLALEPAQLAWLQEFLSECCLWMLRELATRQIRLHAVAVGS